MSLESLIKMQSSGARSIEGANSARRGGSVLVTLDVTKEICGTAVYWALGNVVRRGDTLKIVGIITHVPNAMGFKTRVDKTSWIGGNGVMLQHEINVKREALENVIPHVNEWCDKAGVTLHIDVKAGYVIKTIIVDEAKAIGAYHVVLDRNMKSDRKYFVDNLTCFVSRARNSGGVDTIRSFSVAKQLPPLVPTPPRSGATQGGTQASQLSNNTADSTSSIASLGSSRSIQSQSSGSGSDFLTQDSDLFSLAPTTGESLEVPASSIPLRSTNSSNLEKISDGMQRQGAESEYYHVNRKPALRKWLAEEDQLQPPADAPRYAEIHNPSSFIDRSHKILDPALVAEQTVQRTSLEKSVHAPPLPAVPGTPGRALAPVKSSALPASPLSRMSLPQNCKLTECSHKTVWVWTRSKEVMRFAVEVGWTTFIFTPDTKFLAPQWTALEWIKPLFLEGGRFLNQEGKQVALLGQVYSGEQLDYLSAMMSGAEIVVINDLDWQILPPEDVVAAFQGRHTQLFATANTASDAEVYLEALEVGVDGVVLHTDNISEIGALRRYLTKKMENEQAQEWANVEPPIKEVGGQIGEPEQELQELTPDPSMARCKASNGLHRVASSPRSSSSPLSRGDSSPTVETPQVMKSPNVASNSAAITPSIAPPPTPGPRLVNAIVKSVVPVGEGDRVSVDLCNLLNPGEALLVGSFSKGMFLVHSEVQASNTSRKSFRVNAGPVHAYAGLGDGRIAYLSELESGGQVQAVDAHGNRRTVVVGRVSIESTPLVLVVVDVKGESFSVLLQESDSVRLVIPAENQRPGNEAIAVTKLQSGDTVVLSMEDD